MNDAGTRYDIGDQDVIVFTALDRNGAPINAETGQAYWTNRDGVRTGPTPTTNPGGTNVYELTTPVFNVPGRWWWHVTFTTPNWAKSGYVDVNPSPALPPT